MLLYDENQKYLDDELENPVNEAEIRRYLKTRFRHTWWKQRDYKGLLIGLLLCIVLGGLYGLLVLVPARGFMEQLSTAENSLQTILLCCGGVFVGLFAASLAIIFPVLGVRVLIESSRPDNRYHAFLSEGNIAAGVVEHVHKVRGEQQINYRYFDEVEMQPILASFVTSSLKEIKIDDEVHVLYADKTGVLL